MEEKETNLHNATERTNRLTETLGFFRKQGWTDVEIAEVIERLNNEFGVYHIIRPPR